MRMFRTATAATSRISPRGRSGLMRVPWQQTAGARRYSDRRIVLQADEVIGQCRGILLTDFPCQQGTPLVLAVLANRRITRPAELAREYPATHHVRVPRATSPAGSAQ